MGKRRLAVVDLDGTLVSGNTLHEYIKVGASVLLEERKYKRLLKLYALSLLRACRLVSHARFKFGALSIIPQSDTVSDKFTKRIAGMTNPKVEAVIESMRSVGVKVLLATAAADLYVPWIWNGEYIATHITGNHERKELRSQAKLEGVMEYMKEHDCELYAVITDHSDDLPLLRAGAQRNILVNPSTATLREVQKFSGSNLEVV